MLWNTASDNETNKVIRINGYGWKDPNFKFKEKRPSKSSFKKLLIDAGCSVEKSESLTKSFRKVTDILFIKLLGPHQPIVRIIDGEAIVDKSYQIDTKSKSSITSYTLPTNNNIISLNDILKRRSFQIKLPMSNPLLSWCRNVLDKLFQSNIDTIDGISVVTEEPMGNGLMLNINRPAVLQQYFGMNIGEPKDNLIKRVTYGYNTPRRIDPNRFNTKPFDDNLISISKFLMNELRTHNNGALGKEMNLDTVFNSCAILPYFQIPGIKKESSMSYHCDTKHSIDGKFIPSKNGQVQNSPVAIVTYGNNRILKWRLVYYGLNKHGKMQWIEEKRWTSQNMCMSNNSFLLLNTIDEIPFFNTGVSVNKPFKFEHGKIKINKEEEFSISFVFRVVSSFYSYDVRTNMLIHEVKYTSSIKDVIKKEKATSKQKKRDILYKTCTNKVLFQQILYEKYMNVRHSD